MSRSFEAIRMSDVVVAREWRENVFPSLAGRLVAKLVNSDYQLGRNQLDQPFRAAVHGHEIYETGNRFFGRVMERLHDDRSDHMTVLVPILSFVFKGHQGFYFGADAQLYVDSSQISQVQNACDPWQERSFTLASDKHLAERIPVSDGSERLAFSLVESKLRILNNML